MRPTSRPLPLLTLGRPASTRAAAALLAAAAAAALAGCAAERERTSKFEAPLPDAVRQAQRAAIPGLAGTVEVVGLLGETALSLDETAAVARAALTLPADAAGEVELRIRFTGHLEGSDPVLVAALSKMITLAPGEENIVPIAVEEYRSTPADGVAFDLNRNGKSNLEDLVAGVNPAPEAPPLRLLPPSLTFPGGIEVGGFRRLVLSAENVGTEPLELQVEVGRGPGLSVSDLETLLAGTAGAPTRQTTLTVEPGRSREIAVTFAPANAFFVSGLLQLTAKRTLSGVTGSVTVPAVGNPEGGVAAPPAGQNAVTVPEGTVISSYHGPLSALPLSAVYAGLPIGDADLTQEGVQPLLEGDFGTVSGIDIDAAYLVQVLKGQRFDLSLAGLANDADLHLFDLDPTTLQPTAERTMAQSALSGRSAEFVTVDNAAGTGPLTLLVGLDLVSVEVPMSGAAPAAGSEGSALRVRQAQTSGDTGTPIALTGLVALVPDITALAPDRGAAAGGTAVRIDGTNFQDGASVSFAGVQATATIFQSETQLVAVAPPGTLDPAHNPATIVVSNPDGQRATFPGAFTYEAPDPVLIDVFPGSGSIDGGTPVTLTGLNFRILGGVPPTVRFGGVDALEVTFGSPSSLTAVTPPGSVGPVAVQVLNADGKSFELPGAFEYFAPSGPAPQLTSLEPTSGPTSGGVLITLRGANFAEGALVRFGNDYASGVTFVSAEELTASLPVRGRPGTVDVSLANPDGAATTLRAAFTYALPPPSLSAALPSRGSTAGGTLVSVFGDGFKPGATVRFGTVPATMVQYASASLVTAVSPPFTLPENTTSATVELVVENTDGTIATGSVLFEYVGVRPAAPVVGTLVPDFGPVEGGTTVEILGQNFDARSVVTFGGVRALAPVFVSDTRLRVVSPAGRAGTAAVVVRNPDGQGGAGLFSYLAPPAPLALSSVAPDTGPLSGGTTVILAGAGFESGMQVRFGNLPALDVEIVGNSFATARTPPGAAAGAVDVQITSAGVTARLTAAFTYVAEAPLLRFIDPTSSPVAGRIPATLNGERFAPGLRVFFGPNEACGTGDADGVAPCDRAPVVEGTERVRVTVPPGDGDGPVLVTVINPDGQRGLSVFSYIAACQSNDGCASGLVCISGVCRAPIGACIANTDCASGFVCFNNVCTDPASICTADAQCAQGLRCDVPTGRCVSTGGPGSCTTNANCPVQAPKCDPDARVCVTCTSAGDCASGSVCVMGGCVDPGQFETGFGVGAAPLVGQTPRFSLHLTRDTLPGSLFTANDLWSAYPFADWGATCNPADNAIFSDDGPLQFASVMNPGVHTYRVWLALHGDATDTQLADVIVRRAGQAPVARRVTLTGRQALAVFDVTGTTLAVANASGNTVATVGQTAPGAPTISGDSDADGFCASGGDCDDARADVNPMQEEICNNNRDDDCDGNTDVGGVCGGTVCVTDPFEPNDTPASPARPQSLGFNAQACASDLDYYLFESLGAGPFDISLTNLASPGGPSLTMDVFDVGRGASLGTRTANPVSSPATLGGATGVGPYRVAVSVSGGTGNASYNINVTPHDSCTDACPEEGATSCQDANTLVRCVLGQSGCLERAPEPCPASDVCVGGACQPASSCPSDAFEPNDIAGNARALPEGQSVAQACGGDSDFYIFTVGVGTPITLSVTNDAVAGDMLLVTVIEVSSANEIARKSVAAFTSESLLTSYVGAGDYVVEVSVESPPGQAPYTLELGLGEACVDTCAGQGVSTCADAVTRADCVRGPSGCLEEQTVPCGASEVCDFGECVPDPAACSADAFEPNDTPESATPMPGAAVNGVVCGSNLDYFTFTVASGASFDILVENTATPDGPGVSFQVKDLGSGGTVLGSVPVAPESFELLVNEGTGVGPFEIVVTGLGAASAPYRVELLEHGPCLPDSFEPNDTEETASPVEPGTPVESVLCVDDTDFYVVAPSDGASLTVNVVNRAAPSDGGLDVTVSDVGGQASPLGQQFAPGGSGPAVVGYSGTGPYLIRVTNFNGGGAATYGLDIVENPAEQTCADGVDDDLDGLTDCFDPSCVGIDGCPGCSAASGGDEDGDGICGFIDNCPSTFNAGQPDSDEDGIGDACDACANDPGNDVDSDGWCGEIDNCPALANADQTDTDFDTIGDACDLCPLDGTNDSDGDGVCGDVDNCPAIGNAGQENADSDLLGDVCDVCPNDPADDADFDGFCADADNCPAAFNAGQEDRDEDGVGDACDVCVDHAGPSEAEQCNGIDDDCDGSTDEDFDMGFACDGIGACGPGVIECATLGSARCSTDPGGSQDQSLPETCNDADDDCDGSTDEDYDVGTECDGVGECGLGFIECATSESVRCSTDVGGSSDQSLPEVCNALDDNCDGVPDDAEVCGACTTDAFEPNDSPGAAIALGATSVDANVCDTNADFFTFTVAPDQNFGVAVSHLGTEVDPAVRVTLTDLSGPTQLGQFDVAAGPPVIIVDELIGGGPYEVKVELLVPGDVGYHFEIFTNAACVPDGYEPNDALGSETPIFAETTLSGTACVGDSDFFIVALDPGTTLDVAVTNDGAPTDGDVFVEVSDLGEGASPASVTYVAGEGGTVVTGYGGTGPFAIEVRAAGTGGSTSYTLSVTPYPPAGPTCSPDALEPNDTVGSPVALDVSSFATLCAGDEDHYSVPAGPSESVEIYVTVFSGPPIAVAFVDDGDDSSLGGGSYGVGPATSVLTSPSRLGQVRIDVTPTGPGDTDYRIDVLVADTCLDACIPQPGECLDIDTFSSCEVGGGGCTALLVGDCAPGDECTSGVCGPPGGAEICDGLDNDLDSFIDEDDVCGACTPDSFEPNENPGSPGTLLTGAWPLSMCVQDTDVFTIDSFGQAVSLDLTIDTGATASDLFVEIIDTDTSSTVLAQPYSIGGPYTLLSAQSSAASYLVTIVKGAPGVGTYTLDVFIAP